MNPLFKILDTHHLTGLNFQDWLRNLRIVLTSEKIAYVLDKSPPKTLPEGSTEEERITWEEMKDHDLKARCYMLAFMFADLQKQHEKMEHAADIMLHLQELYGEQSRAARYDISKNLFRAKMQEGSSVHEHVLKMIGYIEQLEQLGFCMDSELSIDLVLQSLPESFSQFVMNY